MSGGQLSGGQLSGGQLSGGQLSGGQLSPTQFALFDPNLYVQDFFFPFWPHIVFVERTDGQRQRLSAESHFQPSPAHIRTLKGGGGGFNLNLGKLGLEIGVYQKPYP